MVKQTYGEDAHKKLLDQIYIEHADKQLVYAQNLVGNDVLLPDDDGEIKTFYDHFGDRFFQCTMEQVLQAEYHLNRNFSLRGEASVNEFNSFLGIAPTDDGDMLKELIEKHGYQILSIAGLALAGLGQLLKDKAGNMELEKLVEQKVKEKLG